MTTNDLMWLQEWFSNHCNGDWEHDQIVVIKSYDNPAWGITINLFGTELENKVFLEVNKEISPNDWLYCLVREGKFEGRGGPKNLEEILRIFRTWAER